MPRNGSGVMSLSGANFPAVPATLIESAKYNSNLNDITSALTQSIAVDGQSTITNNIPFNNNTITGIREATAAGEALRFNLLQKGSDIAISSSGTKTIPTEGGYFQFTTSGVYNITGLTDSYNGRIVNIRMPATMTTSANLTLVNSSGFRLQGGSDRLAAPNEVVSFVNESAGVWVELPSQLPTIDLSSYAGSDIKLAIGQSSIYDISAVTSLLLRIVTGDNQEYEITCYTTLVTGSTIANGTQLQPNNANTAANKCINQSGYVAQTTPSGNLTTNTTLFLTQGNTLVKFRSRISTRTNGKYATGDFLTRDATLWYAGYVSGTYDDTPTWTSLGTLQFQNTVSARIRVTRLA